MSEHNADQLRELIEDACAAREAERDARELAIQLEILDVAGRLIAQPSEDAMSLPAAARTAVHLWFYVQEQYKKFEREDRADWERRERSWSAPPGGEQCDD